MEFLNVSAINFNQLAERAKKSMKFTHESRTNVPSSNADKTSHHCGGGSMTLECTFGTATKPRLPFMSIPTPLVNGHLCLRCIRGSVSVMWGLFTACSENASASPALWHTPKNIHQEEGRLKCTALFEVSISVRTLRDFVVVFH